MDALVSQGMANVAAVIDGKRLFVTFENTRYRDDRRALRCAAELLLPRLESGRELVLVPTDRAVPLLTARYTATAGTRTPGPGEGRRQSRGLPDASLDISDLPPALFDQPPASSSFGRLDVVIHPWFEARFGDFDNPVASRTGVAPELRVVLRRGLSLSAQALVTMQDDVPTGESRFRPARVTLNQTVRLPRNIFVSATAGTFTGNRYGVDLETRVHSRSGRWSAGAEAGRTGGVVYARDGWYRTSLNATTAVADLSWRSTPHALVLRATGGTFLDAEKGVRLDAVRQFGELEVGWFVVGSAAGSNGGLTLSIPLLPARHPAPGPGRVRAADAFRWQYRYRGRVPGGRRYDTGYSLEELGRRLTPDRLRESYDGLLGVDTNPAPPASEPAGVALTGTTGLVTIPTADMPDDGVMTVGMNLLDRRHHYYDPEPPPPDARPALVQYASIGFLPFVEMGLRFTRLVDQPGQALGDRTISVRVRVLKEGKRAPAVVAGVHDLVGTRFFHAEYVTASKHLPSVPVLGTVGLHLGLGGDLLSVPAHGRQFTGGFGGISVMPRSWVTFLAEHDSDRVNAAVRLRLRRLTLLGAVHGGDGFSGGIGYSHPLLRH